MFAIDRSVESFKRVFAQDFISKYQIIMENDCLYMATEPEIRKFTCQYCHKMSEKALCKCSKCSSVYYCSANCQKNDWGIHKQECPVLTQLVQKQYPISAVLFLTLRIFLTKKTNASIKSIVDEFYCNFERFPKEMARNAKNIAYVLLKFLNEETDTKNKENMVNLVSKIIQNSFEMAPNKLGIYSPLNFVNHSCNPNAVLIQNDKKIKLVATKPIEKGEQINIQYRLQDQKYFDCFCAVCNQDLEKFKSQKQAYEEFNNNELKNKPFEEKKTLICKFFADKNLPQQNLQLIEETLNETQDLNLQLDWLQQYVTIFENNYKDAYTPKFSEIIALQATLYFITQNKKAIESAQKALSIREKFQLPQTQIDMQMMQIVQPLSQ